MLFGSEAFDALPFAAMIEADEDGAIVFTPPPGRDDLIYLVELYPYQFDPESA